MITSDNRPTGKGNHLTRGAFFALGMVFFALGMVGVAVPGLPVTVFLILSLWAFKRSSQRMEDWLLNHRVFGPTLRDWEANHAIKRRTKIVAIATLWACIVLSETLIALRGNNPTVRICLLIGLPIIAIGVSWYIATRNEP